MPFLKCPSFQRVTVPCWFSSSSWFTAGAWKRTLTPRLAVGQHAVCVHTPCAYGGQRTATSQAKENSGPCPYNYYWPGRYVFFIRNLELIMCMKINNPSVNSTEKFPPPVSRHPTRHWINLASSPFWLKSLKLHLLLAPIFLLLVSNFSNPELWRNTYAFLSFM